jgi:hypothetical protein
MADKALWILLAVLLLLGGYSFVSPWNTLTELVTAAKEQDIETIDALIDVEAVKRGLKDDFHAHVSLSSASEDAAAARTESLILAFLVSEPLINVLTTPRAIARMLRSWQNYPSEDDTDGRSKWQYLELNASVCPRRERVIANLNPAQASKRAMGRYDSFSRFRATLIAGTNHARDIAVTLRRDGLFEWRVSRITLPQDLLLPYLTRVSLQSDIRNDLIKIEASDATSLSLNDGLLEFRITLRSYTDRPVALPLLDLTLTDAKQHPAIRCILNPVDYVSSDTAQTLLATGLLPHAEITAQFRMTIHSPAVSGFRVDLLP